MSARHALVAFLDNLKWRKTLCSSSNRLFFSEQSCVAVLREITKRFFIRGTEMIVLQKLRGRFFDFDSCPNVVTVTAWSSKSPDISWNRKNLSRQFYRTIISVPFTKKTVWWYLVKRRHKSFPRINNRFKKLKSSWMKSESMKIFEPTKHHFTWHAL